MIRHTVAFRLVHPAGSAQEADFLATARELASIPGVERFEQLAQTSAKNDFTFGFSMEFADAAAYDAYNQHPTHTRFVQERWVPEVADFLELDYEPLATRLTFHAAETAHPNSTQMRGVPCCLPRGVTTPATSPRACGT